MRFQVAIDGPVGVGKSTVARLVAERTGFLYVDTGAMYRAVACHALGKGLDLSDEKAVSAVLGEADIRLTTDGGVFLNGRDVTAEIRTAQASMGASAVALFKSVRMKLVEEQRTMAEDASVVMDGRDIGSHVLKDAQVKIYLDASVDVRAQRRFAETAQRGEDVSFERLKKEIEERDYNDKNREESPLITAPGAVVIDTGDMTVEQAIEAVLTIIRERGGVA